jgi:hypothetical protein
LARSAIAFHGHLRSGGGFCFFTGHDTRANPFKFAQHGERILQAKSSPRCKSARSQRKLEISHHEIAPAWAVRPPTLQCDIVM